MDKTGTLMGYTYSAKVVILRGRATNFKTVNSSREQVSQINCISIAGTTIPPFIVFKGHVYTKRMQKEAYEALSNCAIGVSKNSQLNQEIGLKWLWYFEHYTQRTKVWQRTAAKAVEEGRNSKLISYQLLVINGYSSHINVDFIKYCWNHKIIPIYLPPHLTYLLQLLDLVIFSPLKRAYSTKVDKYAARGITSINKEYFLKILGEIRPQIYTKALIRSAFKAAGLLLYNPNRALVRCSTRPSTPPPYLAKATILSSPLHPPPFDSAYARSCYQQTILNLEITPEVIKACVNSLITHL